MKLRVVLAALGLASGLATTAAHAGDYTLTQIDGSWAWGNTQWNAASYIGYVNNSTDISKVDAILHSPYTYSAPITGQANAINTWPTYQIDSLIFSVIGGEANLNDLQVLSSRSFSPDTQIELLSSADGGTTWNVDLNTTTGALGWNDVGIAGTATELITLPFGGVEGDAFEVLTNGDQINIHDITLDSTTLSTSGVPEPATWAMMILGLGMVGFAVRRRSAGVALAA